MNSKFSLFLLGLFLFCLVNLPKDWVDRARSRMIAAVSPAWQAVSPKTEELSAIAKPIVKNEDLRVFQEWVEDEKRVQKQCEEISELLKISDSSQLKTDVLKRIEREKKYLALRAQSFPAQVVFREPSSWSSSLWIAIGEADNRFMGRIVVAPNSPVLYRNALIGVVEYVGETQSRIRLVTDSGLVIAVRAVRGGEQNRELFDLVENLQLRAKTRSDLFASTEEQGRFIDILAHFKGRLNRGEEQELAKGEIAGCSEPFFRSRSAMLKGTGFNYDFPDEMNEALELRSGRAMGSSAGPKKALIQEGDLLVTSGLDGVFPAGIPVAIAAEIEPLKEGAYTYELQAKPVAGDLFDVQFVFVLPSLEHSF